MMLENLQKYTINFETKSKHIKNHDKYIGNEWRCWGFGDWRTSPHQNQGYGGSHWDRAAFGGSVTCN
jgi:hypothetical protein